MRSENNPQNWHQQKTYESLMSYGLNAIKFILIANGGAILSILTFLGQHIDKARLLKNAIILFVVGVIIGGSVNLTAYITQLVLFNQRTDAVKFINDHRTWLYLSILLIIAGIGCFSIGSLEAVHALINF